MVQLVPSRNVMRLKEDAEFFACAMVVKSVSLFEAEWKDFGMLMIHFVDPVSHFVWRLDDFVVLVLRNRQDNCMFIFWGRRCCCSIGHGSPPCFWLNKAYHALFSHLCHLQFRQFAQFHTPKSGIIRESE